MLSLFLPFSTSFHFFIPFILSLFSFSFHSCVLKKTTKKTTKIMACVRFLKVVVVVVVQKK